jgi:hypothetical protein
MLVKHKMSNCNTKYYYPCTQRLAMQRSGYASGNSLFFLLGDHGLLLRTHSLYRRAGQHKWLAQCQDEAWYML